MSIRVIVKRKLTKDKKISAHTPLAGVSAELSYTAGSSKYSTLKVNLLNEEDLTSRLLFMVNSFQVL